MNGAPWNAFARRRLAAFAVTFIAAMLFGAVVFGVEFYELHRKPADPAAVAKAEARANDHRGLEAQFRDARDRTAVARRRADAAEFEVFDFLNSRFVDSTERTIQPHQPDRPTARPNPEWIALNGQLSDLGRHRAELLEKLTPAHPAVQALDGEIAKLQEQLAQTPVNLPARASETAEPAADQVMASQSKEAVAVASSNEGSQSLLVNPPSSELQQEYRNLLLAAGHARDVYRAAVAREGDACSALQGGGLPQIAMDSAGTVDLRSNDDQLEPLATGNSPFPIGAIAILTLFSLLAAALVARTVERPTLTFMSAEEIEATLGLPILGRIGTENRREQAA